MLWKARIKNNLDSQNENIFIFSCNRTFVMWSGRRGGGITTRSRKKVEKPQRKDEKLASDARRADSFFPLSVALPARSRQDSGGWGKNKLKTKRRRRRRQTSSFGGHRSDFLPAKFITFLSFKRVGNIASAIMEMEPAVFTSRLLPRSQWASERTFVCWCSPER